MLTVYDNQGTTLMRREGEVPIGEATVWIDLLNPTKEEDAFVEKQLGISIPTRAEMREIEVSNRLYYENSAYYLTAFIVYNLDAPMPATSTVTFILARNRLVTVRYAEPKAFPFFVSRVEKEALPCNSAVAILAGLLETIVHRQADLIERIQDEVEKTAQGIFEIKGGQQTRNRRLDLLLKAIGKEGDITSRAQESAVSLDRVMTFFANAVRERNDDTRILQRIETIQRDIGSLMEHMRFLTNRVMFLLDATLGMINIEQNQIIKIFSVLAVALMPPTLVGTIYGMNFKHMPELDWIGGYPMALVLMVISAMLPFYYFRRRGWL
ncbi:MAG TPA: magnesium transporter CorA family protein [Hyphomicrobiaceae bacterium]|nr:magnesium transporter CorA family protein [Hyphomicrobiaceae bacterium]